MGTKAKEKPLKQGRKYLMVRNTLGWHIKTNHPLRNPDNSVAMKDGQQLGVRAACNGGLLAPHEEAYRVRPTCYWCLALWKNGEV